MGDTFERLVCMNQWNEWPLLFHMMD